MRVSAPHVRWAVVVNYFDKLRVYTYQTQHKPKSELSLANQKGTEVNYIQPPEIQLIERIRRQVEREFARNQFRHVPQPGHPDFIGPRRRFTMADMYDPRENVPGRTYCGD